MEMDILIILIMAFGLFAILMFILFYIYAKKHYNDKHIHNELELIDDIEDINDEPIIEEITDDKKNLEELNTQEVKNKEDNFDYEDSFKPKKKKDI